MDNSSDLSQNIEEVKEQISILLDRQNTQFTEIMLKLNEIEQKLPQAGEVDNRSIDDLYDEAREAVIEAGKASTSYLQRSLRIGYARAAHLMDLLEENNIIGPGEGATPRKLLEPVKKDKDMPLDNKKTILLIDDDPFLVNLFAKKYAKAGLNVHKFTDANGDIVQRVMDIKPDIISLDLIMSGRDGLEALALLKKDTGTNHIPVVMLTNQSDKIDVDKAKELGAIDYIIPAELTPDETVKRILGHLK